MDARRSDLEFGIRALQDAGHGVVLWSLSPPGYGAHDTLPAFDLKDVAAARGALLASLRRAVGAYAWVVQGPEVIRRPVERLGIHMALTVKRPVPQDVLVERAQAAGFGDGHVQPLDTRPNTAHAVAGYMSRNLARDGHRLSQAHGRVDVSGFGGGWAR